MYSFAFVLLAFISYVHGAILSPRDSTAPVCVGLSVKSNNGDRKIALVIDSSGSMAESDPLDLRLAAGRALNAWLIPKAEATSGRKLDLVTVIDFDDVAYLDYPLGDPAGANSSFSDIDASGGTYIAGGVDMGISQLTSSNSGSTAGRSSIIVFTDGEDSDTLMLVQEINRATSLGIRVSFGFLDASSSVQDTLVLNAITNSGGIYATITTYDASNNFINFAILNGLTHNDNPQGNNHTLLAGLSISQFISGTGSESIFYNAQANEKINFTVESITSGILTAEALFGGKVVNSSSSSSFGISELAVQAPSAGQFEVKVTAKNAPTDSVFIIGATSNMPIQNCSVGVSTGGHGGLSTGGKVGLGLGIPLLIGAICLGAFFLLRHFGHKLRPFKSPLKKPLATDNQFPMYDAEKPGFVSNLIPLGEQPIYTPPVQNSIPSYGGSQGYTLYDMNSTPQATAQDPQHKYRRIKRRKKSTSPYHHHHLAVGHPCNNERCSLSNPQHVCKNPETEPKGPCACTDKNCPLNDKDHECEKDENIPPCECRDEKCPINEEQEKREREKLVLGGAKFAVTEGVKAAIN